MLEDLLVPILVVLAMVIICSAILFHNYNTFASDNTKKDYIDEPPHFMTVVDKTKDYEVYRHDETGVYYFFVDGESTVVMVNPDGTPYTEKGSH